MRGYSNWNYRPYSRLNQLEKRLQPYICRLAPGHDVINLEWLDNGSNSGHTLQIRIRSTQIWTDIPLDTAATTVKGLQPDQDYELRVIRNDDGIESDVRLARTGDYVGIPVNYLHPEDDAFAFSGHSLCSPSLVKLPSGALLASMDVFSGHAAQNLTFIFRSDDGGITWRYVTELFPCFWGKLFWHQGALYMLANTTEYGNLVIGKSSNEGVTWTAPVTILPGAGPEDQGPHKAPMPIVQCEHLLCTAIDYGSWSSGGHANGLLSIDIDADLLVATNWRCTPFLRYNPQWEGAAIGESRGALEGNAVVGPDGELLNVLRYQIVGCTPAHGKALILRGNIQDPEAPLRFGWFADFNGGSNSKYDLLYDAPSKAYWAIVSEIVDEKFPAARNVLSLAVSRDLHTFDNVCRLLDYRHTDPALVGFQYVSFLIDGDDMLFLCRTGINNARNMHDANTSTFHRISRFRQYLK